MTNENESRQFQNSGLIIPGAIGVENTPLTTQLANQSAESIEERMRTLNLVMGHVDLPRSDYGDIGAFFDEASVDYDTDLTNPYFSFSHEILRFILEKHIREQFPQGKSINMLDAGAGTGNWSKFVLGLNENIKGTLFDRNPNMLRVAHQKTKQLRGNFVNIVEGDLEDPTDLPTEKSDLILCLHNVIGMGRDTQGILQNLHGQLEKGGVAFIMAPNKYHAFNFTEQFQGPQEALRVARDGTVKFRPDMPEMFCYTPNEFKRELQNAGFEDVTVLGFPVTVSPVLGDEQLMQKKASLQVLEDPKQRAKQLELEKSLCLLPELAYRGGNSLIAICKEPLAA